MACLQVKNGEIDQGRHDPAITVTECIYFGFFLCYFFYYNLLRLIINCRPEIVMRVKK